MLSFGSAYLPGFHEQDSGTVANRSPFGALGRESIMIERAWGSGPWHTINHAEFVQAWRGPTEETLEPKISNISETVLTLSKSAGSGGSSVLGSCIFCQCRV